MAQGIFLRIRQWGGGAASTKRDHTIPVGTERKIFEGALAPPPPPSYIVKKCPVTANPKTDNLVNLKGCYTSHYFFI